MDSPCIQQCKLDSEQKYCLGCNRTLQEIALWNTLTEKQKQEVLDRLKGQ